MGGKGRRRREKNYLAAHNGGAHTRLPPAPDPSSLDAVPSKLRKLISLTGLGKKPVDNREKNAGSGFQKGGLRGGGNSSSTGLKRKRNDESSTVQIAEPGGEVPEFTTDEKKKKKRKKKKAEDLRFVELDKSGSAGSHRKERRKQRAEARKKKHKKSGKEEDVDFPGHEHVKFGDIVEAPPKLTTVPKALKTTQDASQERIRLQAVDAYRKRKAWASRPGVQLPPPVTTSPI